MPSLGASTPDVGYPPAETAQTAHDGGRVEQRVDHVEEHQDRVHKGDAAAEHELVATLGGCGARVGDHVVGVQHERHPGHDTQCAEQRDVPEPVPDQRLDHEAAHPAHDEHDPAGEHGV